MTTGATVVTTGDAVVTTGASVGASVGAPTKYILLKYTSPFPDTLN